jgi:hypothetical protein
MQLGTLVYKVLLTKVRLARLLRHTTKGLLQFGLDILNLNTCNSIVLLLQLDVINLTYE